MDALGLPGLALAVTDRQGLLKTSAYGVADWSTQSPVTADALFEIGSLGKPFTVIPLLQLHEAGLLDLHAPVSRYLPWFRTGGYFPDGGQSVALERRTRDGFYVPHPDFALALLEFGRQDGRVVEAFHGGEWFAGEGYAGLQNLITPRNGRRTSATTAPGAPSFPISGSPSERGN